MFCPCVSARMFSLDTPLAAHLPSGATRPQSAAAAAGPPTSAWPAGSWVLGKLRGCGAAVARQLRSPCRPTHKDWGLGCQGVDLGLLTLKTLSMRVRIVR